MAVLNSPTREHWRTKSTTNLDFFITSEGNSFFIKDKHVQNERKKKKKINSKK